MTNDGMTNDSPTEAGGVGLAAPALFGAVGPCSDPVQRVNRLYAVNTAASNVRGQLQILAGMSRDNGVPGWYCDRLEKLAAALVTVADLETPNTEATNPRPTT